MCRGAYPVALQSEKRPTDKKGGLSLAKASFHWLHKMIYNSSWEADALLDTLPPWEERNFKNEDK